MLAENGLNVKQKVSSGEWVTIVSIKALDNVFSHTLKQQATGTSSPARYIHLYLIYFLHKLYHRYAYTYCIKKLPGRETEQRAQGHVRVRRDGYPVSVPCLSSSKCTENI